MSNLRNRLIIIGVLLALSVFALLPRKVVERRVAADSTVAYDTLRRFPLKKGLDLAGGMYLAMEIDTDKQKVADEADALERALTVLRERIDQFGVTEPNIQRGGDNRIIIELPGIENEQRALDIVQTQAFLEFQITDETGAFQRVLPKLDQIIRQQGVVESKPGQASGDSAINPLGDLFTRDTTGQGRAGDSTGAGTDSLFGPGTEGPLSSLMSPGEIPGEFFTPLETATRVERYLSLPAVRAAMPPGKELLWGRDTMPLGAQLYRSLYMVDARPIITGDYLENAMPSQTPDGIVVSFELTNEGGRIFGRATERHLRDYMAIVLDGKVMGRPPVIQSRIAKFGQITLGGNRIQEATSLALVLRAGALPVPLRVIETRQIGASLGQDAINQGIRAGILSISLIILIMVVYYRFSGMLAVLGLAFYTLSTLAILAGFDATLTLPGIAGFVLSIGMAVDANFLIFERIREELAAGKTVRTAIDEGFDHAWSAIVDTHVTTALTAAILIQFGTGPVRGFAVALLAGIVASMVSAIFVVRTLFLLWLRRARAAQTLSI